jgi:hypothetical protein
MKRRLTWVWLGIAVLLGGLLLVDQYMRSRGPAAPQFTDLDAALAPEEAHGWKVEIPPKQAGPYRRLPGEPVLAAEGMVCRLTNEQGAVVEEVKLQPIQGYDQAVVYLETADGKKTMAVLKRAR